jgi:tRNA 2-thiouridine synthesizing protein A
VTSPTDVIYDLRGLKCPLPVLKTRRRLKTLHDGDRLVLQTSDPLAGIDIPHFCRQEGHELIESAKTAEGHSFIIRKGISVTA